MNKVICDFCEKNEANKSFKTREYLEIPRCEWGYVIPDKGWVNRDICNECYKKLFKGGKDGSR